MMPKRSGTSADCKPLNGSRLTPASNTALFTKCGLDECAVFAFVQCDPRGSSTITLETLVGPGRLHSKSLLKPGSNSCLGTGACGHVTKPKSRTGSTTFALRTAPESIVLHGKGWITERAGAPGTTGDPARPASTAPSFAMNLISALQVNRKSFEGVPSQKSIRCRNPFAHGSRDRRS
jgi:hypothetical protein